jgi:hypothetical protein
MGLIDRAKNILVNPKEEWAVIEQEEPDIGGIITGYAIPLILLSAICTFVGFAFISSVYRGLGMGYAIAMAVSQVITAVLGLFVSAFVIDALAPSFGSQKNLGRAVQLVAYSGTAAWVAGILNIFPPLMFVTWIASLYGIYILYLGLPHTMKTPDDKRIVYMIVAFVVNAVVVMVLGGILAGVLVSAFGVAALAPGL